MLSDVRDSHIHSHQERLLFPERKKESSTLNKHLSSMEQSLFTHSAFDYLSTQQPHHLRRMIARVRLWWETAFWSVSSQWHFLSVGPSLQDRPAWSNESIAFFASSQRAARKDPVDLFWASFDCRSGQVSFLRASKQHSIFVDRTINHRSEH